MKSRKKKRSSIITWILVLIFLVGVGLLVYPSFSNWWNSFHQTRAVASYVKQVDDMSAQKKEEMWNEAVAYNQKLTSKGANFVLTDEEKAEYEKTLDITGTGIMGYIQIDKIHVSLPIYHGTSQEVLQIAIGHIPGSSLPTGGESTHCVVSGHRGLPSARLFTDIDQLKEGDTFTLQVLDHTLTYEVDQIRIVLPDETQDLNIADGQDYCTLVTCTPYGINTHRLLVRGHRIANKKEEIEVSADALKLDPMYIAPFIGAFLLIVILIWMLLAGRSRRKASRFEEELREKGKHS